MFAIFMAALLRKKAPRIVSNGLERVRAFLNSSSSNTSNIDLKKAENRYVLRMILINPN